MQTYKELRSNTVYFVFVFSNYAVQRYIKISMRGSGMSLFSSESFYDFHTAQRSNLSYQYLCVLVLCTHVNMMFVMLLWTSIPKVAGSIPTVAKHLTFQLARCGCTLRITSQTSLPILIN
jgi:hypothetical protein